ncbi:MAG TPA: SGNH/GDSL hydrolase family protein, partial [Candidatus Hydrogenedentes bacterium]|nr:SGNH/GDSL hydrolase family protein [Candidatus Hydrogenedentota bacterium]
MLVDIRTVLTATAFREIDVELLLDRERPSFVRFDPELGYVPDDIIMQDGMDFSFSTYTYEKTGQRKMMNYPDRPCRINTYGDSFTQCQQVSDDETWQERLAAHLGEPVRNFGCGGYGVYQSYRRAFRMEASECSAKYVILNIFADDHIRNLDAARWIRTRWFEKDLPPGQAYPLHGLPWAHVRFDLDKGRFVELPGACANEDDLRALCDPDRFYETFKDDAIVRLFLLELGGEAEFDDLEAVAEALGVAVNLRDAAPRRDEAHKLHVAYGMKATEYILDQMAPWIAQTGKKLMVVLTYGQNALCGQTGVCEYITEDRRFDQPFLDYLTHNNVPYVD